MDVHRRGLLLAALGAGVSSCAITKMLEPKGRIKVKKNKKVIYEKKFNDWSEMFEAMDGAAEVVGKSSGTMIDTLTGVPPPGHVTLATLSPALAPYAGTSTDYLTAATKEEPNKFRYVQIGVEGFDNFFKASAELYAFVFQVRQTLVHLDERVSAAVEGSAELSAKLSERVDTAVATSSGAVKAEFQAFQGLSVQLATMAGIFVQKVTALYTAGQQLIADATKLITAPKLVMHIDLVVEGTKDSVTMVSAAGKLLGETLGELGSFSS